VTFVLVSIVLPLSLPAQAAGTTREPNIVTDIPYVKDGGHKQQLDLYLPRGNRFATILFVHGGSLTNEDRKDAPYPDIAKSFQHSGVGCALMSYRLGPKNRWPAQPQDVAAGVSWVKKNIAARGGDPRKVFLVGHSSGGLLVALVCSQDTYLKEAGLSTKDVAGCVPIGTLLKAWMSENQIKARFKQVPYFKLFGSPEAFLNSFPYRHVGKNLPQTLILLAEGEQEQPPILADAKEFVAAAKKHGAKAEYEILKDRTHRTTISKMVKPEDPTVLRILRFVKQVEESRKE
jgi:acetyl esterase/lipase